MMSTIFFNLLLYEVSLLITFTYPLSSCFFCYLHLSFLRLQSVKITKGVHTVCSFSTFPELWVSFFFSQYFCVAKLRNVCLLGAMCLLSTLCK
ncbi:hypothetical protein FKM82_017716 [Ascaphus truei]